MHHDQRSGLTSTVCAADKVSTKRGLLRESDRGSRIRTGDPQILVVLDVGYDTPRLAHLLSDLPVPILGQMRSDRMRRRPAPRAAG